MSAQRRLFDKQELMVSIADNICKLEQSIKNVNQSLDAIKKDFAAIGGVLDTRKSNRSVDLITYAMNASDKESVEHTRPIAFTLKSTKFPVKSWKRLLEKICVELIQRDSDHFWLATRKCKWAHRFSSNEVERRGWTEIRTDTEEGTGFYFYPALAADETRITIVELLSQFGYKNDELRFEICLGSKFMPKRGKVPQSWKRRSLEKRGSGIPQMR